MDRSWMPTVAGILNILAGALALVGVLGLAFGAFMVGAVPQDEEVPLWAVSTFLCILALGLLLISVTAIVGGAFALQKRRFPWVVAGSIAAAIVGPPLGVISLVLVVVAEKELRSG